MSVSHVSPNSPAFEAVQLCWKNWGEVCELLQWRISASNPGQITQGKSNACGETGPYIRLNIDGQVILHGDWIVKLTMPANRFGGPAIEQVFVYPTPVFEREFAALVSIPGPSPAPALLIEEQMRSEDA